MKFSNFHNFATIIVSGGVSFPFSVDIIINALLEIKIIIILNGIYCNESYIRITHNHDDMKLGMMMITFTWFSLMANGHIIEEGGTFLVKNRWRIFLFLFLFLHCKIIENKNKLMCDGNFWGTFCAHIYRETERKFISRIFS